MAWYSYNGAILPELPIWDNITYPYVAIAYYGDSARGFLADLYFSDTPFEYDVDTGYFIKDYAQVQRYDVYRRNSEWEFDIQGTGIDRYNDGSYYIWTNHNVYKNTGSLYLAASEPVPIETIADSKEYQYLGDIGNKIPVWTNWDRKKYPHAIVTKHIGETCETYTLTYSDMPFSYEEQVNGIYESKYYRASVGSKVYIQAYVNTYNRSIWNRVYGPIYYTSEEAVARVVLWHVRGTTDEEWEVIWHTALYNEAGEVVVEASPEPIKKFHLMDWITGYFLGMMEAPRTISSMPWYIKWNYPEILENWKHYVNGTNVIFVSDYVPANDELKDTRLDIVENGSTTTLSVTSVIEGNKADIVTYEDDAKTRTYVIYVVRKAGDVFNIPIDKTGIYLLYPDTEGTENKDYYLRFGAKETQAPIAYSYNGVILPALPEWDRERYPYAVIDLNFYDSALTTWNLACIYFSPVPLVRKENVDLLVSTNGNAEVMSYKWTQETGTWENAGTQQIGETVDVGAIGGGVTGFIWTNTDLYNEDGTVYLAASEPIPVYE